MLASQKGGDVGIARNAASFTQEEKSAHQTYTPCKVNVILSNKKHAMVLGGDYGQRRGRPSTYYFPPHAISSNSKQHHHHEHHLADCIQGVTYYTPNKPKPEEQLSSLLFK
ncbi:hypothetical protein B566_EDAN009212 [Ephemera danica]|nr:hypothetical protein B566_EDAN009212 [Ephemera danica]